ncbi:MAG: tetratricopeptide repeat protein, partial [Acidobacteriota bacterium]
MSRKCHESRAHLATMPLVVILVITLLGCEKVEREPVADHQTPVVAIAEIPVTTDSPEALARFVEAQYWLDVGRAVKAREGFRSAVEIDPEFTYAYYGLSNASFSFNEFQEMIDKARATLGGKSDGERLLVEINRTFLTNDADEGLRLALELTESYPLSPRAWLTLASYQAFRNENESARRSAQEALQLDPESAAAYYFLGNNYIFGQPSDPIEAEAMMRKFVETHPSEAKANEGLGDALRA